MIPVFMRIGLSMCIPMAKAVRLGGMATSSGLRSYAQCVGARASQSVAFCDNVAFRDAGLDVAMP
jgi:hypothetical protein